jgi:hypothetical protein
MSPLAEAVYEILRRCVADADPRITYAELARQLRDFSDAFEFAHHRNRELYTALAEVGAECRRRRLPPLPALVVRADTRRPGAAYYAEMGTVFRGEQIAAWQHDLEEVKRARYPRLSR